MRKKDRLIIDKKYFWYFGLKKIGVLLLMVSTFIACVRQVGVQGKGEYFLQGEWTQNHMLSNEKLLNYTEYNFKFTCDSFYVDLTTYSKVNYYPDSCYHHGVWQEYAKGVYVLRHDTLVLLGAYTKANYKQKISGCFASGQYLQSFVIKKREDKALEFENLTNQQKCFFSLKRRIVCKPQKV